MSAETVTYSSEVRSQMIKLASSLSLLWQLLKANLLLIFPRSWGKTLPLSHYLSFTSATCYGPTGKWSLSVLTQHICCDAPPHTLYYSRTLLRLRSATFQRGVWIPRAKTHPQIKGFQCETFIESSCHLTEISHYKNTMVLHYWSNKLQTQLKKHINQKREEEIWNTNLIHHNEIHSSKNK